MKENDKGKWSNFPYMHDTVATVDFAQQLVVGLLEALVPAVWKTATVGDHAEHGGMRAAHNDAGGSAQHGHTPVGQLAALGEPSVQMRQGVGHAVLRE